MNYIADIVGWAGVVFGVMVTVPQLKKSLSLRSTHGVSLQSYQLLFFMAGCYLVRAIVIGDPVFIVSNLVTLVVTLKMLTLFRQYPENENAKL